MMRPIPMTVSSAARESSSTVSGTRPRVIFVAASTASCSAGLAEGNSFRRPKPRKTIPTVALSRTRARVLTWSASR